MVFIHFILVVLSSLLMAQPEVFNRIGSRPKECGQQKDTYDVIVANELIDQTKTKVEENKLTQVVLPGDLCLRVGTEISLELESGEIKPLGTAYISEFRRVSAQELAHQPNMIFSNSSLQRLATRFPQQKMNIADIRMMTRLSNVEMEQKYDRLPSCFVSSGDWRSYRLDPNDYKNQIQKFKDGTLRADIWNGTRNCFKVGLSVDLEANGIQEDLGKLYPTKLFLKHYTEITEEQAQLMGEKLSDLKARLAAKKDEFGGYTTMVAYDYAPPEKPEDPVE